MARAGIPARVLRGLAAVGLPVLTVTFSQITCWRASWLPGPWGDPSREIPIVVAADSTGGLLARSSYWRAVYATLAWRKGVAPRRLIGGWMTS